MSIVHVTERVKEKQLIFLFVSVSVCKMCVCLSVLTLIVGGVCCKCLFSSRHFLGRVAKKGYLNKQKFALKILLNVSVFVSFCIDSCGCV